MKPTTLQYGVRTTRWRIGRRQWRWLAVIVVVAGGILFWRSGIPDVLMVRYAFAQAADYVAPPDQVVYLELNTKDQVPAVGSTSALTLSDRTTTRRFARMPPCLRRTQPDNEAMREVPLFLGKRKAPDGTEHIVYLTMPISRTFPDRPYHNVYSPEYCAQVPAWHAQAATFREPGWRTSGAGTRFLQVFSLMDDLTVERRFSNGARVYRFYAGQRDPSDPSHFTVDFDADDQRVRIHGYLISTSRLSLSLESIRGPIPPRAGQK